MTLAIWLVVGLTVTLTTIRLQRAVRFQRMTRLEAIRCLGIR